MRRGLVTSVLALLLGLAACLPGRPAPEAFSPSLPARVGPAASPTAQPLRPTAPLAPAPPAMATPTPTVSPVPPPTPVFSATPVLAPVLTRTAVLRQVEGLPGHPRWQVTETPYGVAGSRWSPTGAFLEYDVIISPQGGLGGFSASTVILDWQSGRAWALGNQTSQYPRIPPHWLPGDDQVVYQAGGSIWISKAGGTGSRQLVKGPLPGQGLSDLTLAPDGRKLVYLTRHKAGSDLWLLDLATGEAPLKAAAIEFSTASVPSWSPRSDALVFFSYNSKDNGREEYWHLDVRSGQLQKIAEGPPCGCDGPALPAQWLADGRTILLRTRAGTGVLLPDVRTRAGVAVLLVDLVAGRILPVEQLIGPEEFLRGIASPDGSRVFLAGKDRFHILDVKTWAEVSAPSREYSQPSLWLPDSSAVLVMERTYGQPGSFLGYAPWLMMAKGGQMLALPKSRTLPVPSPDSRYLAFTAQEGNLYTVSLLELGPGKVRQLTPAVEMVADPGERLAPAPLAWSPDGSRLAYSSGEGGKVELYVVSTSPAAPGG